MQVSKISNKCCIIESCEGRMLCPVREADQVDEVCKGAQGCAMRNALGVCPLLRKEKIVVPRPQASCYAEMVQPQLGGEHRVSNMMLMSLCHARSFAHRATSFLTWHSLTTRS